MKFELKLDNELEPPQYVFKASGDFIDFVRLMEKFRDTKVQKLIDYAVFRRWSRFYYRWEVFAEINRSAVENKILDLVDRFWVHMTSTDDEDLIAVEFKEDIAYVGDDTWMIGYFLEPLKSIDKNAIRYASIIKHVDVNDERYLVVEWVYSAFEEPTILIYVDDIFEDVVNMIKLIVEVVE